MPTPRCPRVDALGRSGVGGRAPPRCLALTAGLDAAVSDALVVLAAGSWSPSALGAGFAAVRALHQEMDEGRQRRLVRLGFPPREAAELSALHTRNFM